MKKQITLLLSLLLFFGLSHAQTNIPGTWESVENPSLVSKATGSKSTNTTSNVLGALTQIYSSTGFYSVSADGTGSTGTTMAVRVNKPNALATVQKAILISSVTAATIVNGCVTISGVPVNWNGTSTSGNAFNFNNYWADVTGIVSAQINAFPAGISNITIAECNTPRIEGEALLVVFNDPAATEKTIIVMFGAATPTGDNFSVTLAEPIDPGQPGALLDMGLGIGFGYQFGGVNQASQVSVNGLRLTSSAGGEDDGAGANGALITVGGIGDVNTNPANPNALPSNARSDDELYNILPFITNTTTSLNINTINPSGDDNIFLAYFALSGAAIIGEGILLSQTANSGNVGTTHTAKAVVKNSNGQPIPNKSVTFTITAGPNSGLSPFTILTDANGEALFTYTGSGGVGTDNIEACFTNSQNQQSCSNVLSFEWVTSTEPPTITCPGNITSSNAEGVCGANVSYPAATAEGSPAPMITYSHPSGSFFPVGETTVTATATSINGSASCQFTITVTDNEAPAITCPAAITVCGPAGVPAADITSTVVTDNCPNGITVTWQGDVNNCPACVNVPYTITRTYRATDASNNYSECTQTITVNPIPTAVAATSAQTVCTGDAITTIELSGAVSGTVFNWTRDNPGVTGIAASGSGNISGILNNAGANPETVTFTITPAYTNAGLTCTGTPVTATVVVNPAYYFTCPGNMVETITNQNYPCLKAVNTPNPVFCGVLTKLTWKLTGATVLSSPTSGIHYLGTKNMNVGITTVTYTASAAGGITRTCSFTVTVIETVVPEIRCPLDKDVYTEPGKCYRTGPVSLGTPIVSDNCGILSVTNNAPAVYQKGENLVTWTVTDKSGNIRTCVQKVTVYDAERPTITCPASLIVDADPGPGCGKAQLTLPQPVFNDNCGVVTLTWAMVGVTYGSSGNTGINYVPTMDYLVGISTITYTAIDEAGNSRTCTFRVTVKDVTAPVLVCPAAETFCKVANNTYSVPPMVQSDNCTIVSTTFKITGATSRTGSGTNASGIFNQGVSTILWTVRDSHGNISTCTTAITVVATTNPICTPPPFAESRSNPKITETEVPGLSITAWPNPTVNYFNLKVNSQARENVIIKMFDITGKQVQVRSGVPGNTYTIGEHAEKGIYFIEVTQGNSKQKVKLVKLN